MEKNIFIVMIKAVTLAVFSAMVIYIFLALFGGSCFVTYIFAVPFLAYLLMYLTNLDLDESIHIKLKSIEDQHEHQIMELNNKIDLLNEKMDALTKISNNQ